MQFKPTFLVLICCAIFCIPLTAQKYTEGEFSFKLLEVSMLDPNGDSTLLRQILDNQGKTKVTIAFNADYLATVVQNEFGDIDNRTVLEIKSMTATSFMSMMGDKMFTKKTFSPEEFTTNPIAKSLGDYEIVSQSEDLVEMHGFSCQKVVLKSSSGEVTLYKSDEVQYPTEKLMSQNNADNLWATGLLVQYTGPNQGLEITMAIDTFSPKVLHPEWFSISTEGYSDAQELLSFFDLDDEEEEEFMEGQGINLEKAQKLFDEDLFTDYRFDDLKDENGSVDAIMLMHESLLNSSPEVYDALIEKWETEDIISSAQKNSILEKMQGIDKDNRDEFGALVKMILLKDLLADKSIRQNIVNNAKAQNYQIDADQSEVVDQFIEGERDLSAFLLAFDILKPLPPQKISTDIESTKKVISTFLRDVLGEQIATVNVEIEEIQGNEYFLIKTDRENYRLAYNDLRPYDYNYDDEGNEIYEFMDTIELNQRFYIILLDKVKQIAADHDLQTAYSVGVFADQLKTMEGYYYDKIVNLFPELEVFESPLYVSSFPSEDYDVFESDIPISFPLLNKGESNLDLRILSFYVGDIDAGIDYVKSKTKRAFLAYLKENPEKYRLTEESIDEIGQNIENDLVTDPFVLVSTIPGISRRISGYNGGLPKIDPQRNTFKDVFPSLHSFLQGEFSANNLRKGPDKSSALLMDWNGETLSFSSSATTSDILMLKGIHQAMKKSGLKKGVFMMPSLLNSTKTVYYLSYAQKQELQHLLNIRFVEID